MCPGVEAGTVPQVVPRLLFKLHGSADLLEVPRNVNHPKHGDQEEGDCLEHDVEGEDEVDVSHPSIASPLRG